MKITFFLSIYEIFFQRISKLLQESLPAVEFSGISYGQISAKRLLKHDQTWREIPIFTDYLREKGWSKPFDLAFLEQKEKELGIPNLPFYISSDRYISKLSYPKAMRALELCIRFVEEALERQKPDLIIMDDVCCMLSYLIYKIGKKRGVPVWSLGSLKLNHRLSIYDDCLDSREPVERAYRELKTRELTLDERKRAESFLHEYTNHYEPLLYLKTRSRVPGFNLKALLNLFALSWDNFADTLDISRMKFWDLVRSRISRVFRHHLGEARNLFEQPVVGERYVFYPLQVQPERSTLILAPFYCDQLAVIENISKSLPVGYKLYIKDHPIFLGRRPLHEYKRLKSIYNVKLIDTKASSEQIIKYASLVISISNTVGLEAILFEKPLIVLGEVFYKSYRNACYVDNIKELPVKIGHILKTFKADRDELLKFIVALLRGTYPGTRRQPDAVPYVLSDENIRDVSTAILQELKQLFPAKIIQP